MINPYASIIGYEKADLKDYLTKLKLLYIFQPVLDEFKDPKIFKGIVRFILYGYSMESEMLLTTGNSWITIYKKLYETAGLPDNKETFDAIANLKSENVRDAIELWLQLQNNESWTQYIHYRDLRKFFLQQSVSAEKSKDRMDAIKHSKELLAMMEDAKLGFIENTPTLKSSVEALNKAGGGKKNDTLGPQHYAK